MKNLTKRKYSGIRQKHVNEIVWNIYGYKFFKNNDCLNKLNSFVIEDLQEYYFDFIVPIQPRNSGSDICSHIASFAAIACDSSVLDILKSGNSTAIKRDLRGQRILIVDDVITTGGTARKAVAALEKLGARNLSFYALAKAQLK